MRWTSLSDEELMALISDQSRAWCLGGLTHFLPRSVRVLVVYDTDPDGTLPTILDVFETTGDAGASRVLLASSLSWLAAVLRFAGFV